MLVAKFKSDLANAMGSAGIEAVRQQRISQVVGSFKKAFVQKGFGDEATAETHVQNAIASASQARVKDF